MKKVIITALALVPALASAQSLTNLTTLLNSIKNLVDTALPIVVGLGLLAFFWGLVKFVFAAGDEEARKGAKSMMIYSVVALFIMVSIWGLIGFIGGAFNINQGGDLSVPGVQGL
ncbi:MAG: hypothetical protein A2832_01910 [Candidatus Zambryskibacteria bacterium RIFCSPHIGHO2_01_FULL_44_22b]|uniref:TrbC/VirB2 family protein n=2 Tax=Candidatus Zambryskiibacteriota TaxID=1817925 RepID=A0A1G2SXZ4_9BACT|nr:MAG: hypothetical protein A2832_01910 [Candidatus Zambryskibacteria bacterium RIFCSPHIGHO2_01_FULL_44_22b]OHB04901.1 MAG: hypothetical protein A3B16_01675 [Candidatus Zambryskibacteria bacterium RIFCSPLOWO2_01_FULL_45_43]